MEIDKTFPTFKKIYHDLINTFSNINTYKEIFLYLLKVAIYLLLNRGFVWSFAIEYIHSPTTDFYKQFDKTGDDWVILEFVLSMVQLYLFAKLCGLFKKINHLNIFFAILIIVFVDILLNISMETRVQLYPTIKINYSKVSGFVFFTTFNFIVFKFFNFLAKKFPMPFERIGYYTSIEFVKDLANKLK